MRDRTLPALLAASLGSVLLAALPAHAAPPPDTDSIWTVNIENDAVSTLKGTSDQYYTSGLRLGWTSGQDVVGPVAALGRSLWGDGTTRLSVEISQSLFTPRDTQAVNPPLNDRPYAGVLLLTTGIVHDSEDMRDVVDVSLGVIGPDAEGEQVQNGFHNIIGDTPNRGWHYQLPDQPAFEILGQRTWRVPVAQFAGFETDVLPSGTLAIGDIRDYAQAGGVVRFGQGLASDYGVARIEPGISGSDAYTNVRPFAWYAFAGADAQAVGYDVTLDGSTFRNDSRDVHHKWDVGEFEGGLAVLYYGLRLSYAQTWQTSEFKKQKSLFNFGSFALSAKF